MLSERKIATVFGGAGFLGRYVVQRLAAQGYIVRVGSRDTEAAKILRPMGAVGQIVPLYAPVSSEALVARAVEGASVVFNLTGVLNETKKREFFDTHTDGAGRVARLARSVGARLVHVSAIGAHLSSKSAYARSKGEGEQAVKNAHSGAAILRPSIIFGREDRFFNRFATIAAHAPIVPIVHGTTKFQPIYVADVADAALAASGLNASGRVYELGGPEQKSFKALMEQMLSIIERSSKIWDMPAFAAKLIASIPCSGLTKDQIILLESDNIVAADVLGIESLGITPARLDLVLPTYLARYRVSGRGCSDIFSE